MTDDSELDDDPGPGGRWLVVGLAAVVLISLVLGFVLLGAGEDEPTVTDTAAGCRVHPLKYTVTDDPEVFAEQKRFEADVNILPRPGFYDADVDLVAARHAASHAYVVVFYDRGGGLAEDGEQGLRELERRAAQSKAPVIIAPHDEGDDAIVALARGYQLACAEGGRQQAAEVARFAAQLYASVADPADPLGTDGPAPTTDHAAPSPAAPQ